MNVHRTTSPRYGLSELCSHNKSFRYQAFCRNTLRHNWLTTQTQDGTSVPLATPITLFCTYRYGILISSNGEHVQLRHYRAVTFLRGSRKSAAHVSLQMTESGIAASKGSWKCRWHFQGGRTYSMRHVFVATRIQGQSSLDSILSCSYHVWLSPAIVSSQFVQCTV